MRSVNVAELKNQLSRYLSFAKGGDEEVIRDRNLRMAKLVPFSAGDALHQELVLVAAGKLRLPKARLSVKDLSKIGAAFLNPIAYRLAGSQPSPIPGR